MIKTKLLLLLFAGLLIFPPQGKGEEWEVVWKDATQTLRVDRDSVRVDGSEVEYWYKDEVDAVVDWMEHRYHAVSDCAGHRIRRIEVFDPESGQTRSVTDPEWKDVPYEPDDAVSVMHDEVCFMASSGGSLPGDTLDYHQ